MKTGEQPPAPWFVLSNEEGTVLGVYGAQIVNAAEMQGREIAQKTGCRVAMHTVIGNRPHVGQSISMKGKIQWF